MEDKTTKEIESINKEEEILIQGFLGGKKQKPPRYAVEDPEGVDTTEFPRAEPLKDTPGAVSLSEVEVIDLISEGEIDGLVEGTYEYVGTLGNLGWDSVTYSQYDVAPSTDVRWLRSVYWNDVPVVNGQNQYNFQSVQVKQTKGLPNGSLAGLINDELTISRSIGERLRYGSGFSKTYRIFNKEVKAFEVNIRFNSLSRTNQSTSEYGDIEQTEVNYLIKWRPLYSTVSKIPTKFNSQSVTVKGKITYGYIKNTRITLVTNTALTESDFLGWEINIERTTPDTTTSDIRNATSIDSLTEVYGDVFTYPNCALVSARFSAEYFSQVPERSFEAKLLKVKVPSNYDPVTKQYTGPDSWNGTFSATKQWTDNPAWCFYDLLSNKRYGLGNYIDEDQIDKWTLYEIAKYCDTMVPDGEGGVEPRFSCNLVLNGREEAYKVVNDMASIFRAMTYYFAGNIYPIQDSKKSGVWQFTNANVDNGDFLYSSSSRKARHTVAIVRYNDKNNFYRPAAEYIEDIDGIRKYGIREVELTAFGCTSRGQALRLGRWALLSETLEVESVSFVAGLEGSYLRPGDIIQIMDSNRKTQRFGGRTHTLYNPQRLLLDSEIVGVVSTDLYYFSLLTPTYYYEPTQVTLDSSADSTEIRRPQFQTKAILGSTISTVVDSNDGTRRSEINLTDAFDQTNYVFTGNPVWILEGSGVSNPYSNQWEYYRVLRSEELDEYKFSIHALQYESGKFDAIESGIKFDISSSAVPPGPKDLDLKLTTHSKNTVKIDYSFIVSDLTNIVGYKVYAKLGAWAGSSDFDGNTYLINTLPSNVTNGSYFPTDNGTYYFRVYSFTRMGVKSTTYAENTINLQSSITPVKDILIGSLIVEQDDVTAASALGGTRQSATVVDENPFFTWQVGVEENGTIISDVRYRVTIREPSSSNTPSKHIYYDTYKTSDEVELLKNQIDNLRYNFTLHKNLNATSTNGIKGPFRDYDVVVEALASDGRSSAGGNVAINGDADYSNSKGYDILYATNPKIKGFVLSVDNIANPSDTWNTKQWITPDGEIKIRTTKGSFPSDLAGAFAYVSTEKFLPGEAIGTLSTTKTITKYKIEDSGNPLVIPTDLENINEAYLGISLFDQFDFALMATGKQIEKTLELNNVVRILKQGVFDQNKQLWAAWIELPFIFNVNYNTWRSDWWKKAAGFNDATYDNFGGTLGWTLKFTDEFPTTDYVPVIVSSRPLQDDLVYPYVSLKSNTYMKIIQPNPLTSIVSAGGDPAFFVGVMYNDKPAKPPTP